MRKSTTHVALDVKPLRFTVHDRPGVLAIHDGRTRREHVLYSYVSGNRHGHCWCGVEAHQLASWLNERSAGYPPSADVGYLTKAKGMQRA